MAYFPTIDVTGNNSVLALWEYNNITTGYVFWDIILAAIYILVMIALSRSAPLSRVVAADGFLIAILAGLLFVIRTPGGNGLIDETALIISLVLAFVGFIMLMFSQEQS